jgi:hypothetical protein
VTNTGASAGADLVQLYITTPGVSDDPVKRLKGFQQVYLTPGQARTVTLTLPISKLAFWDAGRSRFVVRDGRYGVQIANSAAAQDVLLDQFISISGRMTEVPGTVTASPVIPGDPSRGIKQRVLFPVGAVINPRLTVAMNNSALYGYIDDGASRPLPAGIRVSFATDNPNVVSVSGGTIRTVATGAATVTAIVTYNGASASGQFVVRAMSELAAIALEPRTKGRTRSRAPAAVPLPGFHPDTLSYEVTVPDGQRPPRIAATSADRSARVRVGQPARIPGVARVRVTGPDGITLIYALYFARSARDLSSALVGHQWIWIRPDAASARAVGGSAQIGLEPGDLDTHTARNVLLEPALGNWTITSRLTLSAALSATGQQAGIIADESDGNYLKLALLAGRQLTLTTTDSLSGTPISQSLASVPFTGRTVWLRIVRRGPHYTAYYALDGRHFTQLYSVGADLVNVKVGLFAFNVDGTGAGPTASFGYFHIRS